MKGYITVNAGGGDSTGSAVVDVGKRWIGNSVCVFGGGRNQSEIARGRFECASFVHWAFKEAAVDLGPVTSTSTDTLKYLGKPVSPSELKPGDLVFFNTYKRDGYVGIYIGNGHFLGAQTSRGVGFADMTTGYWRGKFNGQAKESN
ncbi:NlpC/P60 family protein [Peribacillus sp. FSL H8-0477]|uniref:C40 family peptidase n=1 Tax=Peribacillus sp. FSL H8-0477 TaxID=2921388 RepID=UPI0030FC3920